MMIGMMGVNRFVNGPVKKLAIDGLTPISIPIYLPFK